MDRIRKSMEKQHFYKIITNYMYIRPNSLFKEIFQFINLNLQIN